MSEGSGTSEEITQAGEPGKGAIDMNGARLWPDRSGALYWPEQEMLVVADLHFEKGSSFAKKGFLLPPFDTRATLKRLTALVGHLRPKTVIALGDSFHDGEAAARLGLAESQAIRSLTEQTDWIWIVGNHDPEPPREFGGRIAHEIALDPLVFRHEPRNGASPGEIAGHLHPCASVRVKGRRMRRKCYITDGERMIIPSFGAYTGGLDVFDPAFSLIFPNAFLAWLIGRDGIYQMDHQRLLSDAA